MRRLAVLSDIGEYIPRITGRLPGWEIIRGDKAKDCLDGAEIILGWNRGITADYLGGTAALKWIQVTSAGVDFAPMDILEKKNIYLTTASGVHANSISESVIGMMLGFCRQLFNIHKDQMSKNWNHEYSELGGLTEIHGKTIGIIGAGAIGQELARLAKAFNMRVLGYRRTKLPAENADETYGPGELRDLLAKSDYVVNILPLTPETDKLIGREEFKVMKNTSVYINAGRGKTTDTDALIEAMISRRIAGAGLDVVDPEPLPKDSPLWDLPNVFIGSHNSGATDQYNERVMEIFFDNLGDYLAGKAPSKNLVDYKLRY